MSRPGVVPALPRRSRMQPTLDNLASPPSDAELAADIKRVKARLAQHDAVNVMKVKARLAERANIDIMRVKTRLAERAAAKASAANVPANIPARRQEVPRVPRVARQPWQQLRNESAGRYLAPHAGNPCKSLHLSHPIHEY